MASEHEQRWREAGEACHEGEPPPVGPADALRALSGVLTQELASIVAERQQAAEIALEYQQRRETVISLEKKLAEEQKRERAARRRSSQGLTPAERRRRAREPFPASQVVHELEVAQAQLVQSLKIIEQRYTDEATLTSRVDRSIKASHTAQVQLAAQTDAVERLEQTVRGLGDEVLRLRQIAREQADWIQDTLKTHSIELQQMKAATAREMSLLVEQSASERHSAAEQAATEIRRVTQEAACERHRLIQEAASEKEAKAREISRLVEQSASERQNAAEKAASEILRVTQEAASEKQRLVQEAASEKARLKERLVEGAEAEKQRIRDDAASAHRQIKEEKDSEIKQIQDERASEIMRIKDDAAAEMKRIQAEMKRVQEDFVAEKQQIIQRHGQELQSARAEARADALNDATRTIAATKAEARLASAAVTEAATAASQSQAKAQAALEVLSERSSAATAAGASTEEYEDTLETLSRALLGLRKTNAKLAAQKVDSDHKIRSAKDRMAELEEQVQSSIKQVKQAQAERDDSREESKALRNGRAALRSDLATVNHRLEAVMQANQEASGRLLTAEHALIVGSDSRPRLLEQLDRAARCLLQETELQEAKLAKGIEAIYLAFASGDPVVDKVQRYAAVAARSSAIYPSGEVDALRSALTKLCSNETENSGASTPTSLQKRLQQECGLTRDDCNVIVDRLIEHTQQQQVQSSSTEGRGPGESAFKIFLRLGWECMCDEHKRQSISSKFGILTTELVMVAEGQHAWARRTAVLRGDCLLFFGEREYVQLGVAPRNNVSLRTALVGQLVEIPSISHPMGVTEIAFSVSSGDMALFWIRAVDSRLTRQLHLSVLTAQRSSGSQ